jgi:hypothetical protein
MPKSPSKVAQAFVTAINAADISTLRTLMTDSHTFTDALGNSFSGADKMQLGWQHFFHTYPSYRVNITHSLAEKNHAALFGNATGGWRVNDIVLPQRWTVSAARGWPKWRTNRSATGPSSATPTGSILLTKSLSISPATCTWPLNPHNPKA